MQAAALGRESDGFIDVKGGEARSHCQSNKIFMWGSMGTGM